jgi:hypothetical protein
MTLPSERHSENHVRRSVTREAGASQPRSAHASAKRLPRHADPMRISKKIWASHSNILLLLAFLGFEQRR